MRTLGLSGRAKAMEFLGKKRRRAMSNHFELECRNNKIKLAELWFLEDFKGYTKRKLLVGKYRKCLIVLGFSKMVSLEKIFLKRKTVFVIVSDRMKLEL